MRTTKYTISWIIKLLSCILIITILYYYLIHAGKLLAEEFDIDDIGDDIDLKIILFDISAKRYMHEINLSTKDITFVYDCLIKHKLMIIQNLQDLNTVREIQSYAKSMTTEILQGLSEPTKFIRNTIIICVITYVLIITDPVKGVIIIAKFLWS